MSFERARLDDLFPFSFGIEMLITPVNVEVMREQIAAILGWVRRQVSMMSAGVNRLNQEYVPREEGSLEEGYLEILRWMFESYYYFLILHR